VALRKARGDVAIAIRALAPWFPPYKFPEWYYLGPYCRVEDPDRDLPNRECLELTAYDRELETDRNIEGERLIAPFNDANSIDEAYGALLSASGYPAFSDAELTSTGHLQDSLAMAADRTREKLRRNKNATRATHFENAIRAIELAKDMYFDAKYADGEELIFEAERLLQAGNKGKA
jgi:hypothetical protein